MNKPKKKSFIIKVLLYLASSVRLLFLVENWVAIPLAVFRLVDFKKGYTLCLRDGTLFKVFHFMEALTINEIFGGNEYLLKKNGRARIIIDIGANIGVFSIFAALRDQNTKVFAFEPSQKTFKQLMENIQLNKLENNIVIHNKAIGGKRGQMKLYNSGVSGQKSIYKTRGEKRYEIVRVITLKDVLEQNKLKKCDFLKIDCEGAEYEILFHTPLRVFKKIKTISLEFHELTPNQNHNNIVELLKKSGYSVKSSYHKIEDNIGYIYATR